MPKKSEADRLEALRRARDELNNRIAVVEAKKKERQRKDDTRRKIIVGGAVLAHAALHPSFADALRGVLAVAVTRDIDKAVIVNLLEETRAGAAKSA